MEKFSIKNFRSVQRLEINTADASIVTLIGSISVGKSSVLRSLELFWNEYIYDQERENLQERIFFSNVQKRTEKTKIEAEWHFVCTNETIEQIQFDGSVVKQFLIEKKPSKIILKLEFDPATDKKPARYVGWKPKELDGKSSTLESNNIKWLTDEPYSNEIETFHLEFGSHLLFRFRADFNINVEFYIKKLQEKPKEKKSLENLVSRVFGEPITFDYMDNQHANNNVNPMFDKAVILKRNGTVQPFKFLSHSSKRLLAMLSILNTSSNHYPENTLGKLDESIILPKILLIDSPEIGDPRAQRELGEILIEYSSRHQIFLATQAPRFMLGSVYLVKLHYSSTIVTPITTQEDLEQVVTILGIKPSDSLSSDAVVFVEGITDSTVFRVFLEKIERAENLPRGPLVSFVPVDGWSKMSFTISVRILKSKYVRTHAYAIVDGDTWKQSEIFHKIQNSFENIFGHKNFLRLKEECLETIFLNNPRIIAKVFSVNEFSVRERISYHKKFDLKDKDVVRELVKEYSGSTEIYSSEIALKFAREFEESEIPDRIQRLFRKILWDSKE